ncbi:MAG: 2'-5' RNA ligase [Planctomycetes bacterium GWF2_41_51]|nr:MAG: 2'-5' RNA ligase [Planctomycetes bacterium GWF2_41_51]HBG27100.1 RNA 2',3'-cyclic phosphodiesterase [Phycisphaerales bacterium]
MRCFIAADISSELRGRIEKLQSELKRKLKNPAGIKWVNPELIHLTLKFLGDVQDDMAEEICQTLEIVCDGIKSFELEFSRVGCFGRPPKVLWLGVEKPSEELQKLAADLEDAFAELGFEKEQRDFSPHLTLARVKEGFKDRTLPQTIADFGKVDAPKIKIDGVCFYKSQLTSDGPVYTLLKKINFK